MIIHTCYVCQELDEIKPYPAEILPGSLYLGNWRQGNALYIQKDLKLKAHINCCVEAETVYVWLVDTNNTVSVKSFLFVGI